MVTADSALVLSSSITALISAVKPALCTASFLISSATTAKPFPASPALAASMAALRAKRLVWSEIDWIISEALDIFSVASLVSTITELTLSDILLFSSVSFTKSLRVSFPSSLHLSIVSVASPSSSKVVIIPLNSLFAVSTEAAAACVSSAWLVAPSAMFVTAVATSPAASAVD